MQKRAQVVETANVGGGSRKKDRRLVRRTRFADSANKHCGATWRHHSFITSHCDLDTIEADRFHRQHAIVELAIREFKDGGAEHIPSGHYSANAAWFACAVVAHNLTRWAAILGKRARAAPRCGHLPSTLRTSVFVQFVDWATGWQCWKRTCPWPGAGSPFLVSALAQPPTRCVAALAPALARVGSPDSGIRLDEKARGP